MWLRSLAVLGVLLIPAVGSSAESASPINKRIAWTDSRIVGSPEPMSPYKVVRSFRKLSIKQPLTLIPEPGTQRLFALQHLGVLGGPGRLLAFRDDQNVDRAEVLLEIDGLAYGMTLHPDYEKNRYIYIGLNRPVNGVNTTQYVRYTVDRRPPYRVDPASRLVIIEWPSNGHNGGDLAFGNDGFLYVTAGDGSSDSDTDLTGQTLDDLLGAVLRVDVNHPDPGKNYGIPKDNPFVGRAGARGEIWAYGLRNPWRLTFDRKSGQLWAGQNGQDLWEQVYLIKKGANYGWSLTEGSHVFNAQRKAGPDPISPPTAEHPHSEARSLTGGQVYRGKRLSKLVGAYVYGDWSTGRIWGVKHDGTKTLWHRELVDTPFNITGFGTDHSGELYVIDQVTGFHHFEPTSEADRPRVPFPTRLSASGLFTSLAGHKPHPAAIPFDVAAPQWADGASLERFALLAGMERIEQKPQLNAGGAWTFPEGSVMVQTLRLVVLDANDKPSRRRIETRVLVRQQGEWNGFSYRWNVQQTDAELVPRDGASAEFEVPDPAEPGGRRDQIWKFPARTECLLCHSRAAGFVLGFSPLQLDRNYEGATINQRRTLEKLGLFDGPLRLKPGQRRLVDPYDTGAPLESRAKSYLHVNCSMCHVKEGGGNARMEMEMSTPLSEMGLVGQTPLHQRFDLPNAQLIAPGSPERSVLYHRISRRGTGQMPPVVSTEVDRRGVEMIKEWIRSLPGGGAR